MHSPIGAKRWAAIRALREGKPPIFSLLAAAAGLHPGTVRDRASRENWKRPDTQSRAMGERSSGRQISPGEEVPVAMRQGNELPQGEAAGFGSAARLGDFVARRLGEIVIRSDADGGRLDKGEIDALGSMIRTAEKTETLMREQTAEEHEVADDAELAARLALLDDRIIELAKAHAEWLVAGENRRRVD